MAMNDTVTAAFNDSVDASSSATSTPSTILQMRSGNQDSVLRTSTKSFSMRYRLARAAEPVSHAALRHAQRRVLCEAAAATTAGSSSSSSSLSLVAPAISYQRLGTMLPQWRSSSLFQTTLAELGIFWDGDGSAAAARRRDPGPKTRTLGRTTYYRKVRRRMDKVLDCMVGADDKENDERKQDDNTKNGSNVPSRAQLLTLRLVTSRMRLPESIAVVLELAGYRDLALFPGEEESWGEDNVAGAGEQTRDEVVETTKPLSTTTTLLPVVAATKEFLTTVDEAIVPDSYSSSPVAKSAAATPSPSPASSATVTPMSIRTHMAQVSPCIRQAKRKTKRKTKTTW